MWVGGVDVRGQRGGEGGGWVGGRGWWQGAVVHVPARMGVLRGGRRAAGGHSLAWEQQEARGASQTGPARGGACTCGQQHARPGCTFEVCEGVCGPLGLGERGTCVRLLGLGERALLWGGVRACRAHEHKTVGGSSSSSLVLIW